MKRLLSLIILTTFFRLGAQEFIAENYSYSIKKTAHKIKIDGEINEAVWEETKAASPFWQHYPLDTVRAIMPTILKMTYDDENIYVSAWCKEDNSSPIIQNLVRDDNANYWNSDAFSLAIDPLNSNSTGYFFGLNAGGGKQDGSIAQQSLQPSLDMFWNNSWNGQARHDSNGYYYEMAIPFSSIKYDANNTTWGINFIRNDMKRNAFDLWTQYATAYNGLDFAFNGLITFEDGLPVAKGKRLELTPAASGQVFRNIDEGEFTNTQLNGGLDLKYAISENVNLDVAVLPDFSTVEVDKQFIDFYRYEYKVPEQRSLFLENNDLFALPGSDEDFSIVPFDAYRVKPLYTRRIGIRNWEHVPITYGAKLSGSIMKDLRLGVFNVQQESWDGEAAQNYSALGFQKSVLKNSSVSGLVLNRQAINLPQTNELSEEVYSPYNRNAGLEFDFISKNNTFSASVLYHRNFSEHQNEKAGFIGTEIDYRGKKFRSRNSIYNVGENFIADMGYVPRLFHYDDANDTIYRIGYTEFTNLNTFIYFPGKKVRTVKLSSRISGYLHNFNYLNEFKTHLEALLEFEDRSLFIGGMRYNNFDLLFANDILKNDNPLPAGKYVDLSGFVQYTSNPRTRVGYHLMIDYGKFYNGTMLFTESWLSYKIQPWATFSLNYNLVDIELPETNQSEQYHLVGGRAEVNFSRDISWTTLMQYNTQIDNININSLFKWRYRPLSDFHIVLKNDSDLMFKQKRWQVVFKLNYWLQI